jgi:hypothetical protein
MKKLYNFKEYNRFNENQDMMFMPVDPIKGTPELYSNILQEIKRVCGTAYNQVLEILEEMFLSIAITPEQAEQALYSAEKFFGKDPKTLTYDEVKRKLEMSIFENQNDPISSFNRGRAEYEKQMNKESIAKKISKIIGSVFSNNIVIKIGAIIACVAALFGVWKLTEEFGAVVMTFGAMIIIYCMYKALEAKANIERIGEEERINRTRISPRIKP